MFDIGFWEILLILVLALVVIGPERLPGAARQAGMFVGKARRYIEGVRTEVEEELDVSEFKRMLHNQEVQINELQEKLKSGVDDIKPNFSSDDILTDTPSHSFYDEKDKENDDADASSDDDKKKDMDLDWMHDHFDKIETEEIEAKALQAKDLQAEKDASKASSTEASTDSPKESSTEVPTETPAEK